MTKLRPPLQRADSPLLRVWGRTFSVYADMPTMNIHISLKFHAVCTASSVVKINYNDLGLKGIYLQGELPGKRYVVNEV